MAYKSLEPDAGSEVRKFTTTLATPAQPANPSPANGATDQLSSVLLQTDEATGATYYRVVFSDNQDHLVSPYTNALIDVSNLTESQYPVSGLINNKTFYWRMIAVNDAGSTESSIFSFTTSYEDQVLYLINAGKDMGGWLIQDGDATNDVALATVALNDGTYIYVTSIDQPPAKIKLTTSVVMTTDKTNWYTKVRASKTGSGILTINLYQNITLIKSWMPELTSFISEKILQVGTEAGDVTDVTDLYLEFDYHTEGT